MLFYDAMQILINGGLVRRPHWPADEYIKYDRWQGIPVASQIKRGAKFFYNFALNDVIADDWCVYKITEENTGIVFG